MKFATAAVTAALVAGATAGDYSDPQVLPTTTQTYYTNLTTSQAGNNASVSYTTQIVTAFTTYCPEATSFAHGGTVYTATTLTITNCPCTVTKPVPTTQPHPTGPYPIITSRPAVNHTSTASTTTKPPSSGFSTHLASSTASYKNSTGPSTSTLPIKTSAAASASHTTPANATKSTAPFATGAADKNLAASGLGLAAVLGFAAYFM